MWKVKIAILTLYIRQVIAYLKLLLPNYIHIRYKYLYTNCELLMDQDIQKNRNHCAAKFISLFSKKWDRP